MQSRLADLADLAGLADMLTPFQRKALKTAAVGVVGFGLLRAAEGLRAGRELPHFKDLHLQVSQGEAALFCADYTIAWAMFRLGSVVADRVQSTRRGAASSTYHEEVLFAYHEASRTVAAMIKTAVFDNDYASANKKLKRAEARLDALEEAIMLGGRGGGGHRAAGAVRHAVVVEEDVETVKACLAAHLKNSMIDAFFPAQA